MRKSTAFGPSATVEQGGPIAGVRADSRLRPALGRALGYLLKRGKLAWLPYLFLIVAALSQLAVPRLLRNVIDAMTTGAVASQALDALKAVPETLVQPALPRIVQALGKPADTTYPQLISALTSDRDGTPRALAVALVTIVLVAVLRGLFAFLQAFWAEKNSQSIAYDLRNDLYAKVQGLSFSYYDRNQTGQLMVRATDDVEKVRLFIGQGLLQLMSALLLLSGTLIILFSTNAALALVTLPILPIALVLFMVFGVKSRPLFGEVQKRLAAVNTVLQENLASIKLLKAFTREPEQQAAFRTAAGRLMEQSIAVARLFVFMFPVTFLIANIGQSAITYIGGRQIINGTLTIGQWQEFTMYLAYLFMPIAQFGFIITQLGQASASAERVYEILDAENEITDKPDALALPQVQGHVVFEQVSFRYLGTGEPVLKNVSFEALPGQTVALLGATGSGKTTIINLLPRFYDPTEGRITVDGHDLRNVQVESLRTQIGIVLQETTLFAGTVAENIAFGRPDASREEIVAAAQAAAAHEFIQSFPQGYDTPVGERGATLSGGQKQRVAIARVLLLDPRILILDDSTSSVDLATEAQIQGALEVLMRGRTSFVIAQRISTVMNADQILVLDKGEIVARGTYADLLEDNEIYADICTSQLLDPADSAAGGQCAAYALEEA